MSTRDYVIGVLVVLLLGGSVVVLARRLRAALLEDLSGPPAWLADAVIAVAVLTTIMEALGSTGVLRRSTLVLGAVVVMLAGLVLARRRRLTPHEGLGRGVSWSLSAILSFAAITAVAPFVLARWVRGTTDAFRLGMIEYDTIWYHLPFAARFVQDGWVVRPHYVGSQPNSFLPAGSELIHTAGMLAFSSDLLSPIVNIGWAAVLLLGAWCIGRPFGAAAASLIAAAVVLALPIVVVTQPGSAQSDIAALALFTAAVAFVVADQNSPRLALLGAAAAGLAMSTKPTLIAPSLALAAGAVAIAAPRRRVLAAWTLGLLATGAFWYVRNLVYAGNPLPWFDVTVAGIALPSTDPAVDCGRSSLAGALGDWSEFRLDVYPRLPRAFGPVWAPLLVLVGAGIVSGFVTRRRLNAMLAGVALLAGIAYLFTPATAGGAAAGCFVYNTRFATPAIALALLVLTISVARWGRASVLGALGVLSATAIATSRPQLTTSLVLSFVVVGAVVCCALLARRLPQGARARAATVSALALVAVVAGWKLQDRYDGNRYAGRELAEPLASANRVLGHLRHARIAVVGLWTHYPLYGPDLSNRVDFPLFRRRRADFEEVASCRAWVDVLIRGRYEYVVVVPRNEREAVVRDWTQKQPFAHELVDRPDGAVFRLARDADPRAARCT